MKKTLTIKNILITIGIILFDLSIYIFFVMMLMSYDDLYDESKGEYWSLESMTFGQKASSIGINIWHVINLLLIGYVIYRVIKIIRKNALQHFV